jgi:hypothetical protein
MNRKETNMSEDILIIRNETLATPTDPGADVFRDISGALM